MKIKYQRRIGLGTQDSRGMLSRTMSQKDMKRVSNDKQRFLLLRTGRRPGTGSLFVRPGTTPPTKRSIAPVDNIKGTTIDRYATIYSMAQYGTAGRH